MPLFSVGVRSTPSKRKGNWTAVGGAAAFVSCVTLAAPGRAVGQDPTRPDSTRPIELGEIVVRETGGRSVTVPFSEQRVSLAAIQQRDAAVVADIARLIPAAHLQTNSRGETLVYLRGAGERQVAVFFEGALLNIPWDNRVDLSLIPSAAIGGMTVAQGVPPVEYGANVLGGAVNLTSFRAGGNWSESTASASYGSGARFHASASHTRRTDRVSYTGAFSYATARGRTVPADAALPFSQIAGALRTNTDYRVSNVYTEGVYEVGETSRIGISFLHMDADKGVAPEGHLDPNASRVRFWRYPTWRHTTTIVHGEGLAGSVAWKGAAWATGFAQDIDSYASVNYTRIDERQEDSDLTFGSRLVLSRSVGPGMAKFALNGLTSTHKQRDVILDPSGVPLTNLIFPRLRYRQHVVSLGAEYSVPVTETIRTTVGAGLDAMVAPETGDKPDLDPFTDYSATIGVTYAPSADWFVRAAAGRKTRFPTLRELFGVSLDRFLLNPYLRPESSILAELAVGVEGDALSGEVISFGRFTSNTIDQRNVILPGETRTRRQRINLRGSDVIGLEMIGTAAPSEGWLVQGHLTMMHIRRRRDAPSDPTRIAEKPSVLGRLSLTRDWEMGASALVETVYTGRAYSLGDNDRLLTLNPSWTINLRLEHRVEFTPWQAVRVYVRADNVTDTPLVPQLGLPDQGRTASGGLEFSF